MPVIVLYSAGFYNKSLLCKKTGKALLLPCPVCASV